MNKEEKQRVDSINTPTFDDLNSYNQSIPSMFEIPSKNYDGFSLKSDSAKTTTTSLMSQT
jgi:gamma-glutamylcysteine synthetase